MKISPRFTLLFVATFFLFNFPASIEAQKRVRKKPHKVSQGEAMAEAEVEVFWRDEVEAISRLDPVQRELASTIIESLLRSSRLYKVTGDLSRVEDEFYTDTNMEVLKQVVSNLPHGNVRASIKDAVTTLSDAITLRDSYTRFCGEVSNKELLKIIDTYDLENKPRASRVEYMMKLFQGSAGIAAGYAKRAGLVIREK